MIKKWDDHFPFLQLMIAVISQKSELLAQAAEDCFRTVFRRFSIFRQGVFQCGVLCCKVLTCRLVLFYLVFISVRL